MLLNAHKLHELNDNTDPMESTAMSVTSGSRKQKLTGIATLNYILMGRQIEDSGGIFWTWRLIFSGELFDTEGIWIPIRVLVIQFVQFIALVALSLIYASIVKQAASAAANAQSNLDDNLPSWVKS
jgi:hypothetical protein